MITLHRKRQSPQSRKIASPGRNRKEDTEDLRWVLLEWDVALQENSRIVQYEAQTDDELIINVREGHRPAHVAHVAHVSR